jgi:hypothetical protein
MNKRGFFGTSLRAEQPRFNLNLLSFDLEKGVFRVLVLI